MVTSVPRQHKLDSLKRLRKRGFLAHLNPYGQNIRHIISLCLKNSDEPEKNRFFAFSAGARGLRVHFAAMSRWFCEPVAAGRTIQRL